MRTALLPVCTALWLALLCACQSPIVGAACKRGFTVCGARCVDLNADYRNCGSCGQSCGRFVCDKGHCSSEILVDAGMPAADGGVDASMDSGPVDAGGVDAGNPDAGPNPDAGLMGCAVGFQDCAGVCINPAVDPQHCGGCDLSCAAQERCSAGRCSPQCEDPLTDCGGMCFDLMTDPEHCGSCSVRCTSGICELGMCADAIAGQSVVIGHDFSAANIAMQRLLGNAVFLAQGAPVRVLEYRGESDATSVAGVEHAIDVVKAELGREWLRTDAIESLVPLQLSAADVLLVHAQVQASNSSLRKLGQEWGNALAQFVATGGVVVLIEAPSAQNAGTFQLLEPASLFEADARESIVTQQLLVQTPGLGVAVRVPDRYMSTRNSVHFRGVSTPGTFVVVDKDMLPVLVQRVIISR
jgi:hypothetical protein